MESVGRRLPELGGRALDGTRWRFPHDLSGPTLLLVAFWQRQQAQVDTWLPLARDLTLRHPTFSFFEVPFISKQWTPARAFIDGGMRTGIEDPATRATTVTVYGRRGPWLSELGIASMDDIVVLLVDRDGEIKWADQGSLGPESAGTLDAALTDLS